MYANFGKHILKEGDFRDELSIQRVLSYARIPKMLTSFMNGMKMCLPTKDF